MFKALLLASVIVAVSLGSTSDLVKELKELLEKKVENKHISSELMGRTDHSLTVKLIKDINWDNQGDWKMQVIYWKNSEPKSQYKVVEPGYQTWKEWGQSRCPIPDSEAVQQQCVTIDGLDHGDVYNVGTMIEITNDQGKALIMGNSQMFQVLKLVIPQTTNQLMKSTLLKALRDLLEN